MERKIPEYWKNTLEDIDSIVNKIKKGTVSEYKSAGGRKIYQVEYVRGNCRKSVANYSSACGSGDMRCFIDKTLPDIRPTVAIVGAMHGFEIEGTVAILNLIKLLETGYDLAGREDKELLDAAEAVDIVLIPCANPDGRARVPFLSAVGMKFDDFRFYAQGTWKDGSLCGWPECKRIHPIKNYAGFLGAYYNDDGINMMHDDFTEPMAEETKLVMRVGKKYAPDITLLLHGGTNSDNCILMPEGVHNKFKDKAYRFAQGLGKLCSDNGLYLKDVKPLYGYDEPVNCINFVSAYTHSCGELCVTYESNQGLDFEGTRLDYDEIYQHHRLLFIKTFQEAENIFNENLQQYEKKFM